MADLWNFSMRIGRTQNVTVPVEGIDDWTNKKAVLSAAREFGTDTVLIKENGVIATGTDEVTFEFSASETREMSDKYKFEVTIYLTDGSFVKDAVYGELTMNPVVNRDPTT